MNPAQTAGYDPAANSGTSFPLLPGHAAVQSAGRLKRRPDAAVRAAQPGGLVHRARGGRHPGGGDRGDLREPPLRGAGDAGPAGLEHAINLIFR